MYAGQDDLLLRAMSIPEDSLRVNELRKRIFMLTDLLYDVVYENGPSTGSTPSTTSRAASSEQCSVAPYADFRRSTVVGIGASTRVQSFISPSVSSATGTPRCFGGTASVPGGIASEPSFDPSQMILGSSGTLSQQSRRSSEGSAYREPPTAHSLRTSFSQRNGSVLDVEAGAGETVKLASRHAMSESLRVVQAETLSMNRELQEQQREHEWKIDHVSSWALSNFSELETK